MIGDERRLQICESATSLDDDSRLENLKTLLSSPEKMAGELYKTKGIAQTGTMRHTKVCERSKIKVCGIK